MFNYTKMKWFFSAAIFTTFLTNKLLWGGNKKLKNKSSKWVI